MKFDVWKDIVISLSTWVKTIRLGAHKFISREGGVGFEPPPPKKKAGLVRKT